MTESRLALKQFILVIVVPNPTIDSEQYKHRRQQHSHNRRQRFQKFHIILVPFDFGKYSHVLHAPFIRGGVNIASILPVLFPHRVRRP